MIDSIDRKEKALSLGNEKYGSLNNEFTCPLCGNSGKKSDTRQDGKIICTDCARDIKESMDNGNDEDVGPAKSCKQCEKPFWSPREDQTKCWTCLEELKKAGDDVTRMAKKMGRSQYNSHEDRLALGNDRYGGMEVVTDFVCAICGKKGTPSDRTEEGEKVCTKCAEAFRSKNELPQCVCGHYHDGDVCDDCDCTIYRKK